MKDSESDKTSRQTGDNPDTSFDDDELYRPIEVKGEQPPALNSTQQTVELIAQKYFKICRKVARTITRLKRNRSD